MRDCKSATVAVETATLVCDPGEGDGYAGGVGCACGRAGFDGAGGGGAGIDGAGATVGGILWDKQTGAPASSSV